MESTWASGSLELLKHADAHKDKKSAFDKRIAFISIDNSVETSIRTFLTMPNKISRINIPHKEIEEAKEIFPKMVALLFKYAPAQVTGLDEGDFEHYHRIRNKVYHDGTGVSVDQNYIEAYRQIAAVLLKNLFGISLAEGSAKPTLSNLIVLWNEVETLLKGQFDRYAIDSGNTYKWEKAIQACGLDTNTILQLTELRTIRNTQVHSGSENLNSERIAFGVKLAEELIVRLNAAEWDSDEFAS